MGNALGNLIAGLAAGSFSTMPLPRLFGTVAWVLGGAGLLLILFSRPIRALIGQLYTVAMERYKAAFHRALPELPREELNWRLYFMFGTLSYTLTATDTVELIAGVKPEDRYGSALELADELHGIVAGGLKVRDQAGTDETRGAGNQDAHGGSSTGGNRADATRLRLW